MARPRPQVIISTVADTDVEYEILSAEDCYIIVYKREPINIRMTTGPLEDPRRKYMKISYTNEGSARARVRYLNKLFNCEDFAFVRATV